MKMVNIGVFDHSRFVNLPNGFCHPFTAIFLAFAQLLCAPRQSRRFYHAGLQARLHNKPELASCTPYRYIFKLALLTINLCFAPGVLGISVTTLISMLADGPK